MRIPITAAKQIAEEYNLEEVMIVGWDAVDGTTWTATYGSTRTHCRGVAMLRDKFMNFLGFKPRNTEVITTVEGQSTETKQ